jgi:hypothetical protein
VLLGSRDIPLEQLIGLLSEEEHELLLQAAVSRLPQSLGDLALARWGPNANLRDGSHRAETMSAFTECPTSANPTRSETIASMSRRNAKDPEMVAAIAPARARIVAPAAQEQ